jgi:hypothetical protein
LFFDGHVAWLSYADASGAPMPSADTDPDPPNWGVDHADHGGVTPTN